MKDIVSIELMSKKVVKMLEGHQYEFVIGNVSDLKVSSGCCLYFDPTFQNNTDNDGHHTLSSLIDCGMIRENEKIVCKKQIHSNSNSIRNYIYITNFCNLFIPAFISPNVLTFGLIHCDTIRDPASDYLNYDIYKLLSVNEIYTSLIYSRKINNCMYIPDLLSVIDYHNTELYADIIKTVDMIKTLGLAYSSITNS